MRRDNLARASGFKTWVKAGSARSDLRTGPDGAGLSANKTPLEENAMDLRLTPDMEAFRDEVRAFLTAHKDRYAPGAGADRPREAAMEWQAILIDNGYAARTIPKAYGGYGAEPDILKSRIIAEAFTAAGAPRGFANQGISMLVGGTEDPLDRAHPARRDRLVPRLFRTGRRFGPCQPPDQGG
jgi:alkylation response protein AidB-like acyl-CoA dehydrogenase